MKSWIVPALGLALLGPAGAAWAQATVVLTCSMARATATSSTGPSAPVREDRIFRVGPKRLQEWKADQKQFGPNLCASFACVGDAERSEGTIKSSSVIYTIGFNNKTGAGYWSSKGASGLAESQGVCAKTPDPTPPPRR